VGVIQLAGVEACGCVRRTNARLVRSNARTNNDMQNVDNVANSVEAGFDKPMHRKPNRYQ
jgi:hypothetical protein